MLFLLFQLGQDRYALDAAGIAEVLPLVEITPIPQAPMGVAGLFNYRGAPVPAIDLSALALGQPARRRLSTRIVLVHYPDGQGDSRKLGLIAEKATETMRADPGNFTDSGVNNKATPYLGPVMADARGVVQWVDARTLLPPALRDMLFQEPAAS
jgi:chemotaxis-related protein WspB